jgi:RNA polymerase sigma factor (sigma-70 family)
MQMAKPDDMQLLRDYAATNSEDAFATLVQRHVNLVYSVALRQLGDFHQAQDVTQAVFIILARKAARLRRETVLTGWLYQTARFTATSFLRGEMRRQRREQESYMQSTLDPSQSDAAWEQLAPLLDDAMGRLGKLDRNLLLLRFFEGRSNTEAASVLNLNEPAAKRRCTRAIEKLRLFFSRRGMDSTTAAITETISTHSIQIAPATLAKTVTAVALAKGATASASTLTLIKGALKLMAWTKAKTVVVVGVAAAFTVGTATVVVKKSGWWPRAANDHLTVAQIVQKAQARYASLSSYHDEGTIVSTVGGQTITHTFTTMLARTNLFRIAWTENLGVGSVTGMVWSAGNFSLLQIQGAPLQTFSDRQTASASATGVSGGAASTIPGTFFQQNWGNRLGNAARLAKRQADERIGDVDCYVLTSSNRAATTTLWIGRNDLLIHQIRTVTSAAFMKTIMQNMATRNPNLALPAPQNTTVIETHSNIAVDTLTPMDFERYTLGL